MPIVTLTIEERLEILRRDTRDFCKRNEQEWSRFFAASSDDIQHGEVVNLLGVLNQGNIDLSDIITALEGRGQEGADALLAKAKCRRDAAELFARWEHMLFIVENDHDQGELYAAQLRVTPWE